MHSLLFLLHILHILLHILHSSLHILHFIVYSMNILIWAASRPARDGRRPLRPPGTGRRWGGGLGRPQSWCSSIRATVTQSHMTHVSPSAGHSILEALPFLFGPCCTIQAFYPSIRSLLAQSSRWLSLISWRLLSQSAAVMSSKFSSTEAACLTLKSGRYQNMWSIKALKPDLMRGTSLEVLPSFFNLT